MSKEGELQQAYYAIMASHYLREHELKIICSPKWYVEFQDELYKNHRFSNFSLSFYSSGFNMTTYMGMEIQVDRDMSVPCIIVKKDQS